MKWSVTFVLAYLAVIGFSGSALAIDNWAVAGDDFADAAFEADACANAQFGTLLRLKSRCQGDGGKLTDFTFNSHGCSCTRKGNRYNCMASGKGYCQAKEAAEKSNRWMVFSQYPGEGRSRATACVSAKELTMRSIRNMCANDGGRMVDFEDVGRECQCLEVNGRYQCTSLVKAFCGR